MTVTPRPLCTVRAGRALFALLASVGLHQAGRADDGPSLPRVAPLPSYQQECAACHLAYPPALLPAASWQRLMSNLSRHFGTDASLDAATSHEISAWLAANAGSTRRVRDSPPLDRITTSAWFTHAHDEVPKAVWKRPAVKSASNCAACHTRTDQGEFNEHDVRIPR
ncbi:MAG: diheme cytochrome c [Rubrivivax sp.]|nr:diheme cytochrome c [Rubrivivax sp.]